MHVGILRDSLLAQGHKISPWQSWLKLQFRLCDSKSSASPTTLWWPCCIAGVTMCYITAHPNQCLYVTGVSREMWASSLVNTMKFDNNDALVMVTLMVFSLHGYTLLHSILSLYIENHSVTSQLPFRTSHIAPIKQKRRFGLSNSKTMWSWIPFFLIPKWHSSPSLFW